MEIGDRIAQARTAAGLTQKELADRIGTSRPTVCRYETGAIGIIPPDKLETIARALHTTPAYLMGWAGTVPAVTDDVIRLPILNEVAAGYTGRADEDWEAEQIEIPRSYLRGRPASDFFLLRVKGNSMYPLYIAGDIVLVLKQATLNRSGDIGVIRFDGDSATLKKVEFVYGEDWMKLIPINPEYPPRLIENHALEECEVLGIPRMVIREL